MLITFTSSAGTHPELAHERLGRGQCWLFLSPGPVRARLARHVARLPTWSLSHRGLFCAPAGQEFLTELEEPKSTKQFTAQPRSQPPMAECSALQQPGAAAPEAALRLLLSPDPVEHAGSPQGQDWGTLQHSLSKAQSLCTPSTRGVLSRSPRVFGEPISGTGRSAADLYTSPPSTILITSTSSAWTHCTPCSGS